MKIHANSNYSRLSCCTWNVAYVACFWAVALLLAIPLASRSQLLARDLDNISPVLEWTPPEQPPITFSPGRGFWGISARR